MRRCCCTASSLYHTNPSPPNPHSLSAYIAGGDALGGPLFHLRTKTESAGEGLALPCRKAVILSPFSGESAVFNSFNNPVPLSFWL